MGSAGTDIRNQDSIIRSAILVQADSEDQAIRDTDMVILVRQGLFHEYVDLDSL
jgi:hypothetical protein